MYCLTNGYNKDNFGVTKIFPAELGTPYLSNHQILKLLSALFKKEEKQTLVSIDIIVILNFRFYLFNYFLNYVTD